MTERRPSPAADLDRQLADLEQEIDRLRRRSREHSVPVEAEIAPLMERAEQLRVQIYTHPSPWHIVQLARQSQRPRLLDFLGTLCSDVMELHGDRLYRDDPALPAALAIAVGDAVLMLQYAVYTVISPEGCAAILWHDASRARDAAAALKLTAEDLHALGVVDEVLPEPFGGAHREPDATFATVREALQRHLQALRTVPIEILLDRRYEKYRRMGRILEESTQSAPSLHSSRSLAQDR